MVDHIRLSLMSQIQNKQNINIPQLILLAIVVGVASWAYDTVNGEGNKFRNISLDIRSYIMRKNSVKIEGKHVIGIELYSRRPIVVSNTFSKNFQAIMFHAINKIDKMADVRELKEFATKLLKETETNDDIKTIFTVSQKHPFLIDAQREIYCIVNESGESREDTGTGISKSDTRIIKIVIHLFSYKTSPAGIKEYIKILRTEYSKYLEEKRRGKIFTYTLNNTEVNNEDDDDTVGGWRETLHETMKSFDNIFFEGKQAVLKKIQFFTNNKEWYRKNGVPYTLGIALYGLPGTGKTSFIKAIATLLGRHIISISLSKIKTKKQLYDFYYETQYNNANDKNAIGFDKKIIVFEDIDCVGDVVKRRNKKTENVAEEIEDMDSLDESGDLDEFIDASKTSSSQQKIKTPEDKVKHEIAKATKYVLKKMSGEAGFGAMNSNMNDNITLDDILNLWDGIRENTGRIMIITTNHYDKLDPALIRPGRIDMALNMGNASRNTIAEMYLHYYGAEMDPNDLALIPDLFYSPAEVINFYVSHYENPRGFIERLVSGKKI
jgi:hypothetical protein